MSEAMPCVLEKDVGRRMDFAGAYSVMMNPALDEGDGS